MRLRGYGNSLCVETAKLFVVAARNIIPTVFEVP